MQKGFHTELGFSVCPLEVKPADVPRRPSGGGAERAETSYNLKTMQVTRPETHKEEDNLQKTIHQTTGIAWTLPL